MPAKEFIDTSIPFLKPNDTVGKALDIFEELKEHVLPLVESDSFIGFFTEEVLLNFNIDHKLEAFEPLEAKVSLLEQEPLPVLVSKAVNSKFELLPVFSTADIFLGVARKYTIYETFIQKMNLQADGAFVEIYLKEADYSLAEISRIIEMESAKIISLFTSEEAEDRWVLSLKLNKANISGVISALERFGYEVLSYYSTVPVSNFEKDRYNQLMKYLSV